MKVVIQDVKGKDIKLKCHICGNEEFDKNFVIEKKIKIASNWSGEYRDGLVEKEVNQYTCTDCGNTYIIHDEYGDKLKEEIDELY